MDTLEPDALLAGACTWKNRAFHFGGKVAQSVQSKSIFQAFQNYHRIAYSHNPLVNTLFDQFTRDIDDYIPMTQLMLTSDGPIQTLFKRDDDISTVSWFRIMKK